MTGYGTPHWARAERVTGPAEAIRRLEVWARRTGLTWDVEELWAERPGTGAAAVVRVDLLADGVAVGEGMGKGRGLQARASGMYEAFEDFALSRAAGPRHEAPGSRLAPDEGNALIALLAREQTPVATVAAQPLTVALSGLDGETVLLPAALVDLDYRPEPERRSERVVARYCTSNGVAAGLSAADALLHGLLEVAERDALGALLLDTVSQRGHGSEVSLAALPELRGFLRSVSGAFGVGIEVRELESAVGRVVLAWSTARDGRGCRIVGAGASWDLAYAADRALLELVQNLVVEPLFPAAADGMADSLVALERFPNLLAAARLERLPAARSTVTARHRPPGPLPDQVHRAVATLRAAGHEVYARPLLITGPGGPAPQVWQVVAPGLDRFHLVRAGWPVEPVARLRTPAALTLARQTRCA